MQEKKLNNNKNLEKKCEEYLSGWKRALADFENYKKSVEKQQQEFSKFANLNLIMQLIPVYNNLKLALKHSDEDSKWLKGVNHIKIQFQQVLEQNGVKEIMPKIGDKINLEEHEIVEEKIKEKREIKGSDKIFKVMSCGYKLNNKVFIPAKVIIK